MLFGETNFNGFLQKKFFLHTTLQKQIWSNLYHKNEGYHEILYNERKINKNQRHVLELKGFSRIPILYIGNKIRR